jgi:hypothetical protein
MSRMNRNKMAQMKKVIVLGTLLFAATVLTVGCKTKPVPHSVTNEDTMAVAQPTNGNQAEMGRSEILGTEVVTGTLVRSKGNMGQLGGRIIPAEFLTGGKAGGWKPEMEALLDKQVEAKGIHVRYHCGPIEQCLEGGVIDYLTQIEYIRLAK